MSPIARILVTPLVVALLALVGDGALAAQSATVRHDYRLAALALVVATTARAAIRTVSVLLSRRKRTSHPQLPYATTARPKPTLR